MIIAVAGADPSRAVEAVHIGGPKPPRPPGKTAPALVVYLTPQKTPSIGAPAVAMPMVPSESIVTGSPRNRLVP